MKLDELKSFCGSEITEPFREYLHAPFSRGDFTFATDGKIMVRVSRVRSITAEAKEIKHLYRPLEGLQGAEFRVLPRAILPEVRTEECDVCEGRGTLHDCPDCECGCEKCNGTGDQNEKISVAVDGVPFALRYIKKLLALPHIAVAKAEFEKPLLFQFLGGVGSLMPLRAAYDRHFEPFIGLE